MESKEHPSDSLMASGKELVTAEPRAGVSARAWERGRARALVARSAGTTAEALATLMAWESAPVLGSGLAPGLARVSASPSARGSAGRSGLALAAPWAVPSAAGSAATTEQAVGSASAEVSAAA